MVASGDLRANGDRQDRLEQAAQDTLDAVQVLRESDPSSGAAVEAKAGAQAAVRQAMLASGVRRIGAVRT